MGLVSNMRTVLFQISPLILITSILSISTYLFASLYSVSHLSFEGWANRVIYFPILFFLCFIVTGIIESFFALSDFIDPKNGQVNIRDLWKETLFKLNPWSGVVVSSLMGLGIIGCANLAEIYRTITVVWYDNILWTIEKPLFVKLIGSWVDVPELWDHVYFSLWVFVFISMAIVYRFCPLQRFVQVAMAVVIAFYITRCSNLLFPTAGPAFYNSELFNLAGTHCAKMQQLLRLYMDGQVTQNGLMPGTMAMPSLHVGLMGIAVWQLAHIWRRTLWVTIPWFLMVWMSTVMLGWHYVLDGIGGIIVIAIAMLIARIIFCVWSFFGVRGFPLRNLASQNKSAA
ncbi:hypothetical protein Pcar_0098 [Syntrophotalea carbinolica DSM 2380]|uniref:Inositolphosphotransferase Aur1/Ipt1 domain-containing protein n=1 Tax=Syntrophotalea carbinolica (strain DSM 2380 / NBRC 103641 / GraBd1) TaxID=338963 RepID=Q3A8D1_SYNC1|nr:hypothetical protein Pcar_0098 [Syntrophotalea carbinolica DSM 2380]